MDPSKISPNDHHLNQNLFGPLGLFTAVDVDRHQDRMHDMLKDLGRSDRDANLRRHKQMTHAASLALLNSNWLLKDMLDKSPVAVDLSEKLGSGAMNADQVEEALYLKALFRYPNPEEAIMAKSHLGEAEPLQGTKDLIWMLFNHFWVPVTLVAVTLVAVTLVAKWTCSFF